MAIFSRIKVWVSGEILYAADLNNEFNNLLAGFTPNKIEGASANVSAMQAVVDPGQVGTESLAGDLLGEIQRLRFEVREIKGTPQHYGTPATDLATLFPYQARVANLERWHDNTRVTTNGSDPGIGGICFTATTAGPNTVTGTTVTSGHTTTTIENSCGTLTLTTTGRPVEIGFNVPDAGVLNTVANVKVSISASPTFGYFYQLYLQTPDTVDYTQVFAPLGVDSAGAVTRVSTGFVFSDTTNRTYDIASSLQSLKIIVPASAATHVFRPLIRFTVSWGSGTGFISPSISLGGFRAYAREL